MKVLLIDDSPMEQKIVKIYLEKGEGYKVIIAEDGKRGINIAEIEQPDLILLDLEMPDMKGEEVLKVLKDNNKTKDIPIVICSGSIELNEEDFVKKGASACIRKPHGFKGLKRLVKEIVKEPFW